MFVDFKKIKFKNILSYGNKLEDFDFKTGLNLIRASNGSGKSTIIDAMSFVLFGKPYRDIKLSQLVNKYNEKELYVEIEFNIGSDSYTIKRGLKPNIFSMTKNGQEIDLLSTKKLNQDEINKIIGIDYTLFKNVVCVSSITSKPFLMLAAHEKRALIESIFNIDIISEMLKDVKKRNTVNKTQQRLNISSLNGINENINSNESYIRDIASNRLNYENNKRTKISLCEQKIVDFNNCIKRCNETIKMASEKVEILKDKISNKDEVNAVVTNLVTQEALANKRINEIEKILKNLDGKVECPLCHSMMCNEHASEYIKTLVAEKENLSNSDISTRLLTKRQELQSIVSTEDMYNKIQVRIGQERAKLVSARNSVKAENDRKLEIENETFNMDETPYQVKLEELNARKTSLKSEIEELDKTISIDDNLTEILGDEGVKMYFLHQLISVLNTKVNKYLGKFELPVHIEFSDNLEPTISQGRFYMSYNQFSCGERSRIDVAILLAFFDISRSISNWSCSVLFMDEVVDNGVDGSGIEQYISVLNNTVQNKENCHDLAIYLISHKLADVNVNWASEIEIEKKQMFSQIVRK